MSNIYLNINGNFSDKLSGRQRLFNPRTGGYLHLSCEFETRGTAQAWKGSEAQAKRIKQKTEKSGQPFPYEMTQIPDPKSQDLYRAIYT